VRCCEKPDDPDVSAQHKCPPLDYRTLVRPLVIIQGTMRQEASIGIYGLRMRSAGLGLHSPEVCWPVTVSHIHLPGSLFSSVVYCSWRRFRLVNQPYIRRDENVHCVGKGYIIKEAVVKYDLLVPILCPPPVAYA
jgi:hypothetical protein